MIRVYEATERLFNHNGIKILNPIFAEITKVDNGDYYIELDDVLDNLEYYQKGMIIRATTPWGIQGFRCDNPVIQNNGISCKAWHLSYDSENYVINEASAKNKNCNDAINIFNDNTDAKSPFTVISDIEETKSTSANKRSLFWAFSHLASIYDGHFVRDNFTFGIMSRIGQDRGVVLAYNKNITDIKVEENWDEVCTKILPYAKDGDDVITLDEVYLESSDLYDIPYTKVMEFSYESQEEETDLEKRAKWKEWLHRDALAYLEEHKHPKVNYSVEATIDNVSDVGDIIHVKHPKCKVEILTNVISVKYDAIKGKYNAIEFGNFRKEAKNLVDEVASTIEKDIDEKTAENNTLLRAELEEE